MNNENQGCNNCIYWEIRKQCCIWNYHINEPLEICKNSKFKHKDISGWVDENKELKEFINKHEPKTIIKSHYIVTLLSGAYNIFPTYFAAKEEVERLKKYNTEAIITKYLNINGKEEVLNIIEFDNKEILYLGKTIDVIQKIIGDL